MSEQFLNKKTEEYISSRDAARLFGVTHDYISRLCRKGELVGILDGRKWLIQKESLEAFFASRGTKQKYQVVESEDYITSKEAARRYRVTNDYIARLCKQGKLKGVLKDRTWTVEQNSLAAFFATRTPYTGDIKREVSEQSVQVYQLPAMESVATEKVVTIGRTAPRYAYVLAAVLGVLLLSVSAFGMSRVSSGGQSASIWSGFAGAFGGLHDLFFGNGYASVQTVAVAPSAPATHSTTTLQTIIEQKTYPVTERTIERVLTKSGVTLSDVEDQVQQANNKLRSELYAQLNSRPGPTYGGGGSIVTNQALSQRIDQLSNITISNATVHGVSGLTASDIPSLNYVAIGSTIAIANGGTGTTSTPTYGQLLLGNSLGGYDLVATSSLGIVSGGGGTFTSIGPLGQLQTGPSVTLASSTLGSDFTITATGNVITYNLPSASVSVRGLLASSDFTTFNNKISSTSLSATYPLAYNSTTGIFSTAFGTTTTNFWNAYNNFSSLFATNASTTNATTTNLHITNLSLGGLAVDNNGRVYSSATSTLTTISGTLALSQLAAQAANTVLVNNTANSAAPTAIATSSFFGTGTGGQVLTWSNNVPQWIASTTYANGTGILTAFANNTLTITNTGVTSLAATYPLQTTGAAGALTLSTAFGTTTANTFSALNTFNGGLTANILTVGTSASIASTTLLGNSLFSFATTTTFAITGTTGALLKTTSSGSVIAAIAGTDYVTGTALSSAYPFQLSGNATSTLTQFNGGLTAYASSTIGNGTQAGGLTISGGATTTGNAYFGSNIGVGTLVPTAKLDIYNGAADIATGPQLLIRSTDAALTYIGIAPETIKFRRESATSDNFVIGSEIQSAGAGGNIVFSPNSNTTDYTQVERMRLTKSGSVGIGTSSPFAKFAVQTNSGDTATTLFVIGSSTQSATTTLFSVSNTGLATLTNLLATASSTIGNGNQGGGLTINGGATTTGQAYFAGNVGIGTANPSQLLAVAGTTSIQTLITSGTNSFSMGTAGSLTQGDVVLGNSTFLAAGAARHDTSILMWSATSADRLSATGGHFNFDEWTNSATGTGAFITGTAGGISYFSGNVGIGTSTPTKQLTVAGTSAFTALDFSNNALLGAYEIYENSSTTPGAYFRLVGTNNPGGPTRTGVTELGSGTSLAFRVNSTVEAMRINSSGNVGIGTTAPAYTLDVNGNVNVATGKCFSVNGVCIGYITKLVGIYSNSTASTNQSVTFGTAATASGAFTGALVLPATTTQVVVETWGGGGGGGGSVNNNGGGGGGGGGGYAKALVARASGTYYYTVGAGGAGGAAASNGSAGSASCFGTSNGASDCSQTVSAKANGGGAGSANGSGGGSGGSGSVGDVLLTGQAGMGDSEVNPSGPRQGGAGGAAPLGGGGGKGIYVQATGAAGSAFGGGGAGGSDYLSNNAGGSGGSGGIVITVYATSSPNAAGNDYAEMFPVSNPSIGAGDIVAVDTGTPVSMKLAQAGDTALAGIISTAPGQTLGDITATGMRPVALSGRVPTKINLEGGLIHIGDRIAPSSVPGVGKKAGPLDGSVGIALEPFTGTIDATTGQLESTGSVTVFITIQQSVSVDSLGRALLGLTATSTASSTQPFDFVGGVMSAISARINSFIFGTTSAAVSAVEATSTPAASESGFIGSLTSALFSKLGSWFATNPLAKLSIYADSNATTTALFDVASSSAQGTTTLFSISNTGSTFVNGLLTAAADVSLGGASSSVVTIGAGTVNFTNPATTTIAIGPNVWTIATSTATGTLPIISISAPASSPPSVFINGTLYINGVDVGASVASSSATTTPDVLVNGLFATAKAGLKSAITSALNALQNIAQVGVRNLGAAVYATVGTFNQLFATTITATDVNADTVNAQKLCLGTTCVTETQLQQLLSGAATAQAAGGGSGQSSGTSTPPIITVNGANPATITLGDTYNDLGATAKDSLGNDLTVHTFVNGGLQEPLIIDTSSVATDTIEYVATDTWGNTATSSRTLIIAQ